MATFKPLWRFKNYQRGEEMMLKSYEVLGTDKPILRERNNTHFFLDEIIQLNENPEDYFVSGYVPVIKNKEVFFKAVYSLDLSNFKVV